MSISLSEFEQLVKTSFDLKREIEELEEKEVKPRNKRLYAIERQILEHLQANNMKSFQTEHGMITHVRRPSFITPKTMEDKKKLFGWMQEKGEDFFYAYASVNSSSLNALAKQELERAKEEGDFDFEIPGVGEPTFQDTIQRRKPKK